MHRMLGEDNIKRHDRRSDKDWAVLGIEPRTSRTLSENHATRPNSQYPESTWQHRRPINHDPPMAAALWTTDIHGPTGNALHPMHSKGSAGMSDHAYRLLVCMSKNILSAQSSSLAKQIESKRKRAVLGIEPRTSRTRSENHATRPNSRSLKVRQADLFGNALNTGNRAVLGIEPRTSRTQSENHATRPNSQLIKVDNHPCHPAHTPPKKLKLSKNDPGKTRACNLWFRGPTPYPLGHRTAPYPKQRQIDFEQPRRVQYTSLRTSKTKRR